MKSRICAVILSLLASGVGNAAPLTTAVDERAAPLSCKIPNNLMLDTPGYLSVAAGRVLFAISPRNYFEFGATCHTVPRPKHERTYGPVSRVSSGTWTVSLVKDESDCALEPTYSHLKIFRDGEAQYDLVVLEVFKNAVNRGVLPPACNYQSTGNDSGTVLRKIDSLDGDLFQDPSHRDKFYYANGRHVLELPIPPKLTDFPKTSEVRVVPYVDARAAWVRGVSISSSVDLDYVKGDESLGIFLKEKIK